MQGPPTRYEEDEAPIPTEHDERNGQPGPALSAGDRKAAIRTFPWKLRTDEIQLALPQPPRAEDDYIRATKRPRLEEPGPLTIDEAPTLNTTHDTTVALPPADATAATTAVTESEHPVTDTHPIARISGAEIREMKRLRLEEPLPRSTDVVATENTTHDTIVALLPPQNTAAAAPSTAPTAPTDRDNSNPVTNTHPNVMTTLAPRNYWTPAEDAQLTRAMTNTPKKKHKGEFRSDWVAISAQVPGRTRTQCLDRWAKVLDPSRINPANGSTGLWTEDEDTKLKNAVYKYRGEDWAAIAILVPGRIARQCRYRWNEVVDPRRINPADGRLGKWNEDEDIKLKNAVHKHGGKDWAAIAALVPDRVGRQCRYRWRQILDASRTNPANGRTGKWNEDENIKLKNAVHEHGGKDWAAIAALVQGRTSSQCQHRWRDVSNLSRRDESMARYDRHQELHRHW
jgi:hypothetical protein